LENCREIKKPEILNTQTIMREDTGNLTYKNKLKYIRQETRMRKEKKNDR